MCKIPGFSIEKHQLIHIYVQGILKQINTGTIDIAEIKLPVRELFLWIDPDSFLNGSLEQVYLIVDYVDSSSNTHWKGNNEIELGFFLNLDKQSRIHALQ